MLRLWAAMTLMRLIHWLLPEYMPMLVRLDTGSYAMPIQGQDRPVARMH